MKKARIRAIGVSSILFFLLLFQSSPADSTHDSHITHVVHPAKLLLYSDAQAVCDDSALIVRVRKINEEPLSYDLGEGHVDRFTLSRVEILDVYAQAEGFACSKGDNISILESEWYNEAERTINHTEAYTKMQEGKIYRLYLGYNREVDNFYPIGLLYGKVPEDSGEAVYYGANIDAQIDGVIRALRDYPHEPLGR